MTDEDKNLLELAARAAGFPAGWVIQGWNPLTDNGDALWLAVKLGIEYCYGYSLNGEVQRVIVDDDLHVMVQDGDACAAVRRAIVRAAADVGKVMK